MPLPAHHPDHGQQATPDENAVAPSDLEVDDRVWPDFKLMCQHLLDTWDVDPMYPLLRLVYDKRDLSTEQRYWYTFIYVNWYWMTSAERVFADHPQPEPVPEDYRLQVRKERRCVRAKPEGALQFINWVADKAAEYTLEGWVKMHTDDVGGGMQGWRTLREAFEECPYAGGWASYKLADLLAYTHGHDITADDMGTGSGSDVRGPLAGIQLVTNLEGAAEVLNSIETQFAFYDYCRTNGIPFQGIEQMETCLCNYTSTTRGWYYMGSDLDDMMEQLDGVDPVFWEARHEFYPNHLLGEYAQPGWHGKRDDMRQLYPTHGIIEWWKLADNIDGDPTFAGRGHPPEPVQGESTR